MVDTGKVVVIFRGGGAAVVVATGDSETVDSSMVTFFVVVVLQPEVGANSAVVVGTTWIGVDTSGTVVEEVFSSAGAVVCRIFSVVAGGDVISGLM